MCIWSAILRTACLPVLWHEQMSSASRNANLSACRYGAMRRRKLPFRKQAFPIAVWHDALSPEPVEFDTGANASRVVPIRPSRCRWTRFVLSDGAPARLVETL
jgi:hypothetical protein